MSITDEDMEALRELYRSCLVFSIQIGRDRQDFYEEKTTRGKSEQWKVMAPNAKKLWHTETGLSMETAIHKLLNKLMESDDSN